VADTGRKRIHFTEIFEFSNYRALSMFTDNVCPTNPCAGQCVKFYRYTCSVVFTVSDSPRWRLAHISASLFLGQLPLQVATKQNTTDRSARKGRQLAFNKSSGTIRSQTLCYSTMEPNGSQSIPQSTICPHQLCSKL
jgi:hypothetical protein